MSDVQALSHLWGAWEIEGAIGEGTCGKIYAARREEGGSIRRAAIRHISIPDYGEGVAGCQHGAGAAEIAWAKAAYTGTLQAFIEEIESFESLRWHANAIFVEEYRSFEKKRNVGYDLLIRTELLDNLNRVLRAGPIGQAEAIKMGIDICAPLGHLHSKGITHGNIKNTKIFVDGEGRYKLGLLWRRRYPEPDAGNPYEDAPQFAAPEFYMQGEESPAADVYSLGMVLYRLMNKNRAPFIDSGQAAVTCEEATAATRRRLEGGQLPLPVLADGGFAEILLRACAFDRKDRYADARELGAALRLYAEKREIEKRGDWLQFNVRTGDSEWREIKKEYNSEVEMSRKRKRGGKARIAIVAAALVCAAAMGIALGYSVLPVGGVPGMLEVFLGSAGPAGVNDAAGHADAGAGASADAGDGDGGAVGGRSDEAVPDAVRMPSQPVPTADAPAADKPRADGGAGTRGSGGPGGAGDGEAGGDGEAEDGADEDGLARVLDLELGDSEISLAVGDSAQISAELDYEGSGQRPTMVWSSDNAKVAQVGSTGMVTAKAAGQAAVSVTCGGKTAVCIVKVE
ncbi:MAG: Ig-like domain-containing protein [Clostridiales Family XIII bacterium]|jgi:serine/threonine protein kinase|nr:Ig-like domain-containing protein [Clostridiales Family XIII bacterium]